MNETLLFVASMTQASIFRIRMSPKETFENELFLVTTIDGVTFSLLKDEYKLLTKGQVLLKSNVVENLKKNKTKHQTLTGLNYRFVSLKMDETTKTRLDLTTIVSSNS